MATNVNILERVDLRLKYGPEFQNKAEKAPIIFKNLKLKKAVAFEQYWPYLLQLDIDSLSDNDKIVVMEVIFCKTKELPIPAFICDDWEFFSELLNIP
jgi:hypothetical protein